MTSIPAVEVRIEVKVNGQLVAWDTTSHDLIADLGPARVAFFVANDLKALNNAMFAMSVQNGPDDVLQRIGAVLAGEKLSPPPALEGTPK